MNIIFLLIGVSVTVAVLFLLIFLWAMKSGQYDDTYTPSVRILFEDQPENTSKTDKKEENQVVQP